MLRAGDITSLALTKTVLRRIEALNPKLNAYITVTEAIALDQARAADSELANGRDRGPLHGIPVAIKDLFATKGIRTTSGSKVYRDYVPSYDADVVASLNDAGAVMLGKTNMYELAAGTTGLNPFYGNISNPWGEGLDSGGSSGGSASAVAAGLAFAAIGTDTGCSIREPAHCCGVVGFKPSYGSISMRGGKALVPSMDHVGPITRNVEDARLVLSAIAGRNDPAPPVRSRPQDILKTVKVGIIKDYFFDAEPRVCEAVENAIAILRELGVTFVDLSGPDLDHAFEAIQVCFDEAAEVHRAALIAPNAQNQFSSRVYTILHRRLNAPEAGYNQAQDFRREFRTQMAQHFETVDFLLAPTSRHLPSRLNDITPEYELDVWKNTSIFNFTGQPSISLPCSKGENGHMVGLMLSAATGDDHKLLDFAAEVEARLGLCDQHPTI